MSAGERFCVKGGLEYNGFAHSTFNQSASTMKAEREGMAMGKVKQLKLDRYEHGLLVRALYEEWKQMLDAGADTTAIEDLILRVIDAPTRKRLGRI